MKTVSVLLQTLCVPCACRCRHCLLSWDGKTIGADYDRSADYAKRFSAWLRENRSDVNFLFAFGYSMEHPRLLEAIDLLHQLGSPGAKFLQCDGMQMRTDAELNDLMQGLAAHGMEQLNFTFYGTEAYHDRFAGRKGDYALILRMVRAAKDAGLRVSAGMPLTHENADMLDAVLAALGEIGQFPFYPFIPHREGRGATMEPIRFSVADFDRLSPAARALLNTRLYQPERKWVQSRAFEPIDRRMLLLSLTPASLAHYEQISFADAIAEVEALDDAYYAAVPTLNELCDRYGDPDGMKFYRQRDLYHGYQRRFIQDAGLSLYDVNDERQSGSRRF